MVTHTTLAKAKVAKLTQRERFDLLCELIGDGEIAIDGPDIVWLTPLAEALEVVLPVFCKDDRIKVMIEVRNIMMNTIPMENKGE